MWRHSTCQCCYHTRRKFSLTLLHPTIMPSVFTTSNIVHGGNYFARRPNWLFNSNTTPIWHFWLLIASLSSAFFLVTIIFYWQKNSSKFASSCKNSKPWLNVDFTALHYASLNDSWKYLKIWYLIASCL